MTKSDKAEIISLLAFMSAISVGGNKYSAIFLCVIGIVYFVLSIKFLKSEKDEKSKIMFHDLNTDKYYLIECVDNKYTVTECKANKTDQKIMGDDYGF